MTTQPDPPRLDTQLDDALWDAIAKHAADRAAAARPDNTGA